MAKASTQPALRAVARPVPADGLLNPGVLVDPGTEYGQRLIVKSVVAVGARKSALAAFLLTFFFGPLGMLYSTVAGGLVKAPIRIVEARTVPLMVPADAEILPQEQRDEEPELDGFRRDVGGWPQALHAERERDEPENDAEDESVGDFRQVHRSALVDYKFFVVNRVVFGILMLPAAPAAALQAEGCDQGAMRTLAHAGSLERHRRHTGNHPAQPATAVHALADTVADVLVTDYSSVAFNIAYLDRPTVYFQFDATEVEVITADKQLRSARFKR